MDPRTLSAGVAALLLACDTPSNTPEKVMAAKDSTAVSGVANGPQVVHLKEGGRMEGSMADGRREGQWTSYHPNGMVWSRSIYVGGVENGPTEVFFDTGKPFYKGAYLNGKPFGEWIFYDNKAQETKRVMHDSSGAIIRQALLEKP